MPKGEKMLRVSYEDMKHLCREAAEQGVERYIREREAQQQAENGKMLYNTKRLLEDYTSLKKYVENAVRSLEDVEEMDVSFRDDEIMYFFGLRDVDKTSYSIKRRVALTKIIMAHVDRMLEVYRSVCESSAAVPVQRRWKVVEMKYLKEPKMTTTQIAEALNCDPRLVRMDAKEAVKDLKSYLFGIKAIIMDGAE